MTHWRILRYTISLTLLWTAGRPLAAQSRPTKGKKFDVHLLYVRAGYDMGQKIKSLLTGGNIDAGYFHLGYGKHILEITLGREHVPFERPSYRFLTRGQYWMWGYHYNFYDNWGRMQNEITVGVRYGTARFAYDLQEIRIVSAVDAYPDYRWTGHRSYDHLQAQWLEVTASVKTEIFRHVFLDLFVSGKKLLGGTRPGNFDLLYVPGFYATNISGFGFGWGYGISYRLGF